MAKKKFVPPIKAPARNVKGIGKIGLFEGGLCPTIIAPKYGPNSGKLNGQILGKQGK
jgi:hypothetical protein